MKLRIAVVIPCYKSKTSILAVLEAIGPEVDGIFVVDDGCPQQTGLFVQANVTDARVHVLFRDTNGGVGAATKTGYRAALAAGYDAVVKLDSDGQMDPALIPDLASTVLSGLADYAKGNRFFDVESVRTMPKLRLLGNAVLSFLTKLSSGYWDIFDPTNGFTCVGRSALQRLPLEKVSDRYFFETDMLFRLNTVRAVVADVPMTARYGDEVSGLVVRRVVFEFTAKHFRNFIKRIGYSYYLRDVSLASLELPLGMALLSFGMFYGAVRWFVAATTGAVTATGTIMLAAMPILMGLQLVLAFFAYDISSVPRRPLQLQSPAGVAEVDFDGDVRGNKETGPGNAN